MSRETHFGPGCGCSTVCADAPRPTPTFDTPARIDGRVRAHPWAQRIADRQRELLSVNPGLLHTTALVTALRDLGLIVEAKTLAAVGHLLENCPVPFTGYDQ